MPVLYPASLPWPTREGFNYKMLKLDAGIEMDDGTRFTRRKYGAAPTSYTLRFEFEFDQLALFEAWYKWDCGSGTEEVTIPLNGAASITGRFGENDYAVAAIEGKTKWAVTAAIEIIRPKPVIVPDTGTLPLWPSSLPDPEDSEYAYRTFGATRGTEKDGYTQSRLRFTNTRTDVDIKVILDAEQLVIFDDFVQNTLISGFSWFAMNLTTGYTTRRVRAKLIGAPETSALSSIYQVSMKVQTFEMPQMTEFYYRYGQGLVIQDSITLSEKFTTFFRNGESVAGQDLVGLSERVRIRVRKKLADDIGFTEAVRYSGRYNRAAADAVAFAEAVKVVGKYKRKPTDTVALSEQGRWSNQNYYLGSNYYAEDYYGSSGTF